MAWTVHADGKPTVENIDRWVTAVENSLRTHNKHLGIFSVVNAVIVNQFNGQTVAEWVRKKVRTDEPMFQIV
jgi:hypothetical protein